MAGEFGGISAQGIHFEVTAIDELSPVLAKTDRAAAASAERLVKAAEHISKGHEAHSARTVKAVRTITEAHEKLRKAAATMPVAKVREFLPTASAAGPRISFAGPGGEAPIDFEKARKSFAEQRAKLEKTMFGGSIPGMKRGAGLEEMLGFGGRGGMRGHLGRMGFGRREEFEIEKPTHFVKYQHAAKQMSEALEKYFKKSELYGLMFTRANKDQIEKLITEYRFFGQQVPKALDAAIKALDKYEKKVEEAGKKTKKSLMGTVEDFLQRMRKVQVGETILGGLAFTAMMKLPQGFERAHRLGTEAARKTMMTEEQVFQRARDVLDVQTKTGAKMEEMHEINKALSIPGPVIASYKEAATAAFDLHRMTDLSAEKAATLTRNMQQYYGVSGKGLEEQVGRTAAIAKNTLLSAEEQGDLYEQLKFSGLAMADNARAAKGIADGTTMAAAKMSQYGVGVEQIIGHVKGITEGGVSEQAGAMQALVFGGMDPMEAMDTLNRAAEGSEEAIMKIEEFRGKASARMTGMTAGAGAFGKAAGREALVGMGVVGSTGEAVRYAGAGKGVFADSQSQKALDILEKGGPEAAKLMGDASKEFRTATEERERGTEKYLANLYKTQEGTYKAILYASEQYNKSADSFGKSVSSFTTAQLMGFGWVTEFALAVVALKMTLPQLRTIFGIGEKAAGSRGLLGRLFGRTGALGGAGGAGGIAEGVVGAGGAAGGAGGAAGGAGGLAALMATTVGTASFAAIAGTIAIGAIAGLSIGTIIDKLTDKVPFLKKAKEWTFDKLVEPFSKISDILSGRLSLTGKEKAFEGTKTEGKTIEQLKAERAAKWGEAAKAAPATAATVTAHAPAGAAGLVPSHTATVGDISAIAAGIGATVTSTTGGAHNVGSAHYRGLAADIRTRGKSPEEVEQIKKVFEAANYKVLDERFGPVKPGGVWSGPHLHVQATAAALAAEQVLASRGSMLAAAMPTTGVAAAEKGAPIETPTDRNMLSELRRATAILAQQLAVMQATKRNVPNVFSRETETVNRGGMGG